jgi:hypothetical protein
MKRTLLITSIALFTFFLCRGAYYMVRNATYKPQHGDVIFHVSKSSQSAAIKIGTWSRYSHCGIIIMKNGKPFVVEAENGVELTPMSKWLKRGRMWDHYRVMRLKDEQKLSLPYSLGGKYDRAFRFNNGRYYCSELVWELYKKNNIILCEPNQLKEYHFLYLPMVKKQIKSRGFKLDQEVVAPVDLVKSRKLHTVSYGYGKPFWL